MFNLFTLYVNANFHWLNTMHAYMCTSLFFMRIWLVICCNFLLFIFSIHASLILIRIVQKYELSNFLFQNGRRVKKYRGMGSLEAMTKGSDARYLGDKAKLKIAQGVVGAVADKGSVLKFIPYTMQAVKQGFQDLGASSLQSAHDLLRSEVLRLEVWLLLLSCSMDVSMMCGYL